MLVVTTMPQLEILGDSPTTEDGLGFDSYVEILLEAINDFDAENPLTIGIHGSWGSGKTSLMKMLEGRFEEDKSVKTIWFNAWAYGREEPIGLALLQQVLITFQKEEQTREKFVNVSKSLSKLFADAALRKISGITLEEAQELFKNSIEIKSTLRDDFETAIAEYLQDKRLVVFIDDLDRCLPEKTIEIFEVIKLFLDISKCVFVIGVEREVIERGIEVRYKSGERGIPISGKDYIEKIIQVPFTLPPIREANMTKFIESLGISEVEKGYAEVVAKGTGCNPRKVKMFLNTLRIRQAIAAKSGGELNPAIAAKLFVIEYTFPDFYKDMIKYHEQNFLCTLERLAKGDTDDELSKELEGSEILQKYYKNEDLRDLLKDEPFFCEIDIEPYIYLSEKPPEEVLVFDKSILDELLSDDHVKIKHAVTTIKERPDSERENYVNAIIPKLNDENEYVRQHFAQILGELGDANAVESLIEVLKDKEETGRVRGYAAKALGSIGDAKAVEPLIEVLDDNNIYVRRDVAEALGKIGDARAVEPLIAALKDKDRYMRVSATEALGSIGDARAVEPLKGAVLKDRNKFVRIRAKEALEEIKAKTKIKVVESA